MKTAYRTTYGPPSVLSIREVPTPDPGPNEILVRVHATTVNRTDCGALFGRPYIYRFFVGWPRPREVATGTDFAGEVVAVGQQVSRFVVGDRVMGFDDNNLGSHAEYLVIAESRAIVRIPDGVSFEHAAASMEGAHYARNFMNKVSLAPGDSVLVYGATGAIGSAAVTLLKNVGARVTAVCASEHHAAIVSRGAERVLDHTRGDWMRELADERFAFVFDAVGKSTFGACRPLMTNDGVYISSELGPGGQNIFYSLAAPFLRGPKVRFPLPTDVPRTLELILPLLEEGRYSPLIDRSYTLDELPRAFEYVLSGQKIGNVLLSLV